MKFLLLLLLIIADLGVLGAGSVTPTSLLPSAAAYTENGADQRKLQAASFHDDLCVPFINANPEVVSCTCLSDVNAIRCTYAEECLSEGAGFENIFGHHCSGTTCLTITKRFDFTAVAADDGTVTYEYKSEETISLFNSTSVDYESLRFQESKTTCDLFFTFEETEFKCKSCEKDMCAPGGYIMNCSNIQDGAATETCGSPTIFSLCPRGGAPEPEAIVAPYCFSGHTQVQVKKSSIDETVTTKKMINLAIGDLVQVARDKYEPIYSFGHYDKDASAEYLQIVTSSKNKALEISQDHMVLLQDKSGRHRSVPASMLQSGDKLVSGSSDGEELIVKSIKTIVRQGIFAPFTASGKIVVNNVVASTYIAYQGSEFLQIAPGVNTSFSYQWLAHTFQSMQRLAVRLGFGDTTYTDEGISRWVSVPHKTGLWMLEQHPLILAIFLIPVICFLGFVSLVDDMVDSKMSFFTFVAGLVAVGAIAFVKVQKTILSLKKVTTTSKKLA